MVQLTLRDLPLKPCRIRNSAPRLQTDERAAGLRGGPQAVGLGLIAADCQDFVLLFIQEGDARHLGAFQEVCIGIEAVVGDGEEGAVDREGAGLGEGMSQSVDEVVRQHRHDHVAGGVIAFQVAVDGVRGGVVRQVEGRVRTDLEMNRALVAVGDLPLAGESASIGPVGHGQFILVRVVLADAVADHHIALAVGVFPAGLELRVPGEPVLLHHVLVSIDPEGIAGHLPHNREQDRRPPSPICRISLPEVLAVAKTQALKFCSVRRYPILKDAHCSDVRLYENNPIIQRSND